MKPIYIHSGMVGAPQYANADGNINAILEACLVIGFNLKTATSASASGGMLTLNFSADPQFEALQTVEIEGAKQLLESLHNTATLGIATANLKAAAMLRLQQAGLWSFVSNHAEGADGGGHKSEILARLLHRIELPQSRIILIGDNINDVEAGINNAVHFIGFSTDANRRDTLKANGAKLVSANHSETLQMLQDVMA